MLSFVLLWTLWFLSDAFPGLAGQNEVDTYLSFVTDSSQQQLLSNRERFLASSLSQAKQRLLQDEVVCTGETYTSPNGETYNCTLPPPDKVCDIYNQALADSATCACARYGKAGVQMSCLDAAELCNAENTWCAIGSLDTILDDNGAAVHAISCTNLTLVPDGEEAISTCVQVFPAAENGNFTSVSVCNAELNGKACACSVCTPEQHTERNANVSAAAGTTASVTVDCCAIRDGALATCSPLSLQGRAFVQFDALEDGVCGVGESSGLSPYNRGYAVIFVTVMLVVPWL